MTLARTHAIALVGVQGHVVEIEADIENGLVALLLVGLPDTALREARDRIRSAIVNSQQSWPQRRITVGLSPASLPKRGSAFDLGIALAILAAAGSIRPAWLEGTVFVGELGLDGRLRPVPGVLPAVAAAAAAGFSRVVTPRENLAEAALVPGVQVVAPATLAVLLDWLSGRRPAAGDAAVQVAEVGQGTRCFAEGRAAARDRAADPGRQRLDLADVAGQPVARRAAGTT
jgi:magnesium chelatase family protein